MVLQASQFYNICSSYLARFCHRFARSKVTVFRKVSRFYSLLTVTRCHWKPALEWRRAQTLPVHTWATRLGEAKVLSWSEPILRVMWGSPAQGVLKIVDRCLWWFMDKQFIHEPCAAISAPANGGVEGVDVSQGEQDTWSTVEAQPSHYQD